MCTSSDHKLTTPTACSAINSGPYIPDAQSALLWTDKRKCAYSLRLTALRLAFSFIQCQGLDSLHFDESLRSIAFTAGNKSLGRFCNFRESVNQISGLQTLFTPLTLSLSHTENQPDLSSEDMQPFPRIDLQR